MNLENEIEHELNNRGADFVYFADISKLPATQNKNFPNAVIVGIALSPGYLKKITVIPDFIENMIRNKELDNDEFHLKEMKADSLADYLSHFLTRKGYSAYSQSEDNLYLTGSYNLKERRTPLPHKTIALLAGFGWIGKHNLLINQDLGSAFCMCTVLTDAPITTILNKSAVPACGACTICKDVCPVEAIKGTLWSKSRSRDEIVDVYKCTCCLKCMAFCPWTQAYIDRNDVK